MAITFAALSEVPVHQSVKVGYRDYHGDKSSRTNFAVAIAANAATVDGIVALLEPITDAQICTYKLDSSVRGASGGEAAQGGYFSEVSDYITLKFVSASRCDADIYIEIPAPHVSVLTGPDQALVDNGNADIIAFTNALKLVLTSPNKEAYAGGPLTDYSFVEGVRNRVAREPKRII